MTSREFDRNSISTDRFRTREEDRGRFKSLSTFLAEKQEKQKISISNPIFRNFVILRRNAQWKATFEFDLEIFYFQNTKITLV